jgi:predicted dehydrogenase
MTISGLLLSVLQWPEKAPGMNNKYTQPPMQLSYLIFRRICFLIFTCLLFTLQARPTAMLAPEYTGEPDSSAKSVEPLRVGVVGLVHAHVHWILGREKRGDIEIVGIVEPNRELALQFSQQHGFSMDLVFDTLEAMVTATRPEAVTAFNTIYDHLETVSYCAPLGIHVMVEKPLAVSYEHARKMAALAKEHNIQLLTNYETSWYGSNYLAYERIHKDSLLGPIRKIVFHTGHPGPVEIGCKPEFLDWLTDPEQNGGGALTDFGCYGANLATWLLKGATPLTVTGITQQVKPHLYPKVEDEATIILTYPKTQVIIQASWNWPHNVKDMEVYGTEGYLMCKNSKDVIVFRDQNQEIEKVEAAPLAMGMDDPFAILHKVVKTGLKLPAFSPSSLENNLIVMQILDAARHSAERGQTVRWNEIEN